MKKFTSIQRVNRSQKQERTLGPSDSILSAPHPPCRWEQPWYFPIWLSWMWISAPHCAVYTIGFWHLLLVLRLQNWGGFTENSLSLAWAIICSVRSCWGTLEHPTLFLFLLAPASDGYVLFILTHLLSKHNYSAFAGVPRPRQGLSKVADLSRVCHPRTLGGCVVLERSVLLALWTLCAVSLTLSTLNSALPDLILRPAVPVISVLWWSESRSCLPLFSRKKNFLMGVLSWSSSSCIEILGAFSWTSESVSLHKRCRWWGSSQSFMIHLLGTYLCSKNSVEHGGCYGDQDGNCFCFQGLLFLNKTHTWRGSYSSTW